MLAAVGWSVTLYPIAEDGCCYWHGFPSDEDGRCVFCEEVFHRQAQIDDDTGLPADWSGS